LMELQSNANLRLLNGLFPANSVFHLCFQFVILHVLIPICTQFHHPFLVVLFVHLLEHFFKFEF
jgi:hypothetical protein